jgi:hypothetical protein
MRCTSSTVSLRYRIAPRSPDTWLPPRTPSGWSTPSRRSVGG